MSLKRADVAEVELKRRERFRVGWTAFLTALAILLSAVGPSQAGSKMTPEEIQRAVELRVAVRKCDQAFLELHRVNPSWSHSEASKACASLLPEGPCRSAFLRGEKVLSVCTDTYCAALTQNKRVKGCNDSVKESKDSPATLSDKKLCKRRARVKKKTVVEALWKRRIIAELARYLPGPKAEQLATRMIGFLPRHAGKRIVVQADDPRLQGQARRPLTLFVDLTEKKTIVTTGERHWTFTGLPKARAIDVMTKELKKSVDKQGGASRVELFADQKVSPKFVKSLIDGLRQAGFKDLVFVSEKR